MSRLKVLVAVVVSRWQVVGGAAALGAALGIGYGLLAPEQYEAVSTLVLDPVTAAGASSEATLGIELDLLRSERVAQRVVDNLRLTDSRAARDLLLDSGDTRHTLPEFLALQLMRHFRAAPVGQGGLVQVTFVAQEPNFAAQVANAYAQAYGEISLEMRAAAIRGGVERAGQDLALLRVRLEQARERGASLRDGTQESAAARAQEQFAHLARLAFESSGAAANRGNLQGSAQPAALNVPDEAARGNGDAALVGVAALPGAVPATAETAGSRSAAEEDLHLAQQNLARVEERLGRLVAEAVGAPFPAHLLLSAAVPRASVKPPMQICTAAGLGAGLLLGLLATLLIETFDRRVRRAEDVARKLGVVVLGDLPATSGEPASGRLAPRVPRRPRLRLQRV